MIDAEWTQSTDTYYFRNGPHMPIFNTIALGQREVTLDVDPYGHVTGIRVV